MIYSLLNDYHYCDKNSMISTLDILSKPVRRVLGGKEIFLDNRSSERIGPSMDTIDKIVLAGFLILVFPIGIVSGGSLLIDVIAKKFAKEDEVVKNISSMQKTKRAGSTHFPMSKTNKITQKITIDTKFKERANDPSIAAPPRGQNTNTSNNTSKQSSDFQGVQPSGSTSNEQSSIAINEASIQDSSSVPQAVEITEEKPGELPSADVQSNIPTNVPANPVSGKPKFTAMQALLKNTPLTLSEWADLFSSEPVNSYIVKAVIANQRKLAKQKSAELTELNDEQTKLTEQRKHAKQNELKQQIKKDFYILLNLLAKRSHGTHPEIEAIRYLIASFCSSRNTVRANVEKFRATMVFKLNRLIPSFPQSESILIRFRHSVNLYCDQIIAEMKW